MPIYKGKNRPNTWRVVLSVKGKPQEWLVEGLKSEAVLFEARKKIELQIGKPSNRASPSLLDFCTKVYAPHAVAHLRGSTWNEVRVYQIATLCRHLGRFKLTELTPERIEKYKLDRLAEKHGPNEDKATKPSTINNELRVLGTVLRFAKAQGYPTASVAWKRLPKPPKGRVRVWTADEVRRVYAAAQELHPQLLAMLIFMVNTGVRKGEAIACEWTWVDTDDRLLRIPANEAWSPKDGEAREVPLSNATLAALAGERLHERWTFPRQRGEGRYAKFPKDQFWAIIRHAKVPGTPHTTRHTFASHFLRACPDMFLLAKVMGHSHTTITELYSHLLPGHLDRATNAVDIGPPPRIVAGAMAAPKETPETPQKSIKRH